MCAAQLNHDLGIEARHVPARPEDGIAETIARVVAGEAEFAVSPISSAAPHIAAGALVALGVTAARRSPLLPHVPTLAEAGAEGFDFPIWDWTLGTGRDSRGGRGGAFRSRHPIAAVTGAGVAP